MKEIQRFADYVLAWRVRVFKKKNPIADCIKLKEEVFELYDALITGDPKKYNGELADCFILLLNINSSQGNSFQDLLGFAKDKMLINEERKWNYKDDGTAQHTEEEITKLPFD